ncbi:hypothetical protein MSAN_02037300 [Mycena sanguinolenta]|uniref:Uncharacterized protein n=1 Tax=Mycena sanguinolenta TaxID=230812 RepID=A0A8H6XIS2_9AGAR|nr:hypothetical protein MSAN_02037300 [Mycena sanguinolenta]
MVRPYRFKHSWRGRMPAKMAMARRNPTAGNGAASPRIHLNEGRRRSLATSGARRAARRGRHVTMSPVRQAAQRCSHWDSGLHGQLAIVQKTSPRSEEHKTGRGKRTHLKRRRCTPRALHVKTSRRHHTTSTTGRVEDEVSEEAPSPRAGGTDAETAQRDTTRTLLKTCTPRGSSFSTTAGTARGESRAVPAWVDSLTVVIDTTNWGASGSDRGSQPGDARRTAVRCATPPARRTAYARHKWAIDAPPATTMHTFHNQAPKPSCTPTRLVTHAQQRIPLSFTHATDKVPMALHILSTELISKGPTVPDRLGAASARAEVPIDNIQSGTNGDVGRRPEDRRVSHVRGSTSLLFHLFYLFPLLHPLLLYYLLKSTR